MLSSVSVMVSPSLASLPPQQGQLVGAGRTTRSRGKCAGRGPRTGFARVNGRTVVLSGAASAATSSSDAAVSSSSSCISNWSSSLRPRSAEAPKRSRFILAISSLRCATIASAPEARASASRRACCSVTRAARSTSISEGIGSFTGTIQPRSHRDGYKKFALSMTNSARRFRPPCAKWISPICPLRHVAGLSGGDRDHAIRGRGPTEPAG